MESLSMDLVSDPGEMLNVLAESQACGTAVGLIAPVLGDEIRVTAVENMLIGDDVTIILKRYDITGYMLETNKVRLSDIKSVCPFKSPFTNPYMRTLKAK